MFGLMLHNKSFHYAVMLSYLDIFYYESNK